MGKIRSIALIFCGGILLSYLLHRSTFDRVILQIAIQDIAMVMIIGVLFSGHIGNSKLSSPAGLVAGFLIASLFSLLLFTILHLATNSLYLANYFTFNLLLSSFIVSIFAGALEELVFRAPLIFIKNYKPKSARLLSIFIVLQAILFGLLHYSTHRPVIFVVSASAVGMLLGFVSVQLRSLWFAIGLHAGLDFVGYAVSGVRFGKQLDYPGILSFDDAGNSIKMATSALFPVLGLLFYFWRKDS